MAEHDVMADVAEKVSYYKTRAHRKARSHYLAAKHCQRRHTLLGVPVVAGTSIVGTSIFATLTEEPWIVWKIATGVISIAAAVLAALQTFFGFAEQAEKNLKSAQNFSALFREIDVLQLRIESSKIQDVEQAIERLQNIITAFDEFEKSSPDVPDHIYDKAVHEEIEDETNRLDTQARQHP